MEELFNFLENTELTPYAIDGAAKITAELEKIADVLSVRHFDDEGVKYTKITYVTGYGEDFNTETFEYCWG